MIAFNREEVSKRMKCSSTPSGKVSAQMVIGSAIMAVVVWCVFYGFVIALYRDVAFSYSGLGYLTINSVDMLAFAVAFTAIAFLIMKKKKRNRRTAKETCTIIKRMIK